MGNFIGQEKLFKTINSYTTANIPHALLLLGEEGSGKRTIIKFIASKLGLKIVTITKADQDKLIEYQQSPIKTIYTVDLAELTYERDQNKFLKFIEEPSDSAYIILTNDSEIGVLPTILNRCQKLRIEPYTIDQLKQIKEFKDDIVYKVCRTPGQLNAIDNAKFVELYTLCDKLITILPRAEYANIISIATKINYKEDYNKFDFRIFFNMLKTVAFEKYINTKDNIAYKVYIYTTSQLQVLSQNSVMQKEPFMINFLDGLWKEVK